jgi:hypothetical protein
LKPEWRVKERAEVAVKGYRYESWKVSEGAERAKGEILSEEGWLRAGEKQKQLRGYRKECFEDFNKK